MKCSKCEGTGFISGLAHVDKGKCWMCAGTGSLPESKSKTVTYARSFIDQFKQSGFFPYTRFACRKQDGLAEAAMEKVQRIGAEHPTAERWIMTDGGAYYIGQPVCRSSDWYKLPIDALEDFSRYYSKVYKHNILTTNPPL